MSLKKRKVDNDCRIFNEQWTIDYFCVQCKDKVLCLICKDIIAVFKEYNIKRHYETKHREKYVSFEGKLRTAKVEALKISLKGQQNIFKKCANENVATVRASYQVAKLVAEGGRPFTDGEFVKNCILKIAEEVCPDKMGAIANVSLSASTITRRVEDLGQNLFSQLKEKARSFTTFSLALDESNDVADTAQLLIFIRGINENFEITEELAALKSLKGTTTGENIFQKVLETMQELQLSWKHLRSVTTDGAKNMTGANIGLIGRINKEMENAHLRKPMQLHCIIHQQSLCGKILNLDSVMKIIVQTVNYIRRYGLNHRQFQNFLLEVEAEYGDVLYHSEVRWLSRGKILKRFFELRQEIKMFMYEKLKPVSELSDSSWLWDFAFLTDITEHLNSLNLKLQGKGKLACDLFFDVRSFEAKLHLFRKQLSENNLAHFYCCGIISRDVTVKLSFPSERCIAAIELLKTEFKDRFYDFHNNAKEFRLFQNPFEMNVDEVDQLIQLELIDLQSNDTFKDKHKEGNLIEFYSCLPEITYPNIKVLAREMIAIFGSTYVCEQTFSRMKLVKSKLRSRLTDAHLHDMLRIGVSDMSPGLSEIINEKQAHHSH